MSMNLLRQAKGYKTFNCNSSSTHSCVVLPQSKYDELKEVPTKDDGYGFSNFILKTEKKKQDYFLANLCSALEDLGYYDLSIIPNDLKPIKADYVDHQSVVKLPINSITKEPDFEFYRYFMKLGLAVKNLMILGGNDNTKSYKLLKLKKEDSITVTNDFFNIYNFLVDKPGVRFYSKREKDYLVIFNSKNGHKLRLNCSEIVNYPSTPESVDLKITNYCSFGCEYCYQSSTKEGIHADFNQLKLIIDELSNQGVFEIAIGGGEPTEYPDFVELLEYTKTKGIIPNFTTRSTKWLQLPDIERIFKSTGAIAFSCNNVKSLSNFYEQFHIYEIKFRLSPALHPQIVIGTITEDEFIKIMSFCKKHRLLPNLLGYKPVGFGKDYNLISFDWLEDTLFKSQFSTPIINIDTAFAKQFKHLLEKYNIDEIRYETEEGNYTCYIDAVNYGVFKDSYTFMPCHFSFNI